MREARIILPVCGNDGEPLFQVHVILRKALVKAFGGFTAVEGSGGWVNDAGVLISEAVTVYDVAGSLSDNVALYAIAKEICAMAGQECVYVRDFGGNVELVEAVRFAATA